MNLMTYICRLVINVGGTVNGAKMYPQLREERGALDL